ncbi:MAG: 16S rRNA (cytidine(1402)-2'-O)-methyltransferase [Ilumatobacteraceae bacterium]
MSTLWLVATPIGNLGDLPPRAVEVLAHSALICCEDTRRTGLLLQHAGVRAERLAVCNDHTEMSRIDDVVRTLREGRDVSIVSDAGTPGISDPGERIVRAAIDADLTVSAVPGPSAAVMALTISGLSAERFVFEGFIPRKGSDRAARLAEIAAERRTSVIYEAPHRVLRTLDDLRSVCGDDRMVVVTRELTKLHETVVRGPLGTIDIGAPRGEYVLVLDGAPFDDRPATDDQVRDALRREIDAGATTRDAAATVAKAVGRPKREVYNLAIALNDMARADTAARADAPEPHAPGPDAASGGAAHAQGAPHE